MTGEIYSRLVSYVVAILAMFVAPIIIIGIRLNSSVQDYVQDKTVEFVDNCRATGYISPENYKLFNNKLGSFGVYNVEITHEKLLSYPDENEGTYVNKYLFFPQNEIFEYMFPDTGNERNYYMKTDDMMVVHVESIGASIGGRYMNAFTGLKEQQIVVNYGGLVGTTTGNLNE